jgi:hypothetical protein
MAKQIIKWKANDGSEWRCQADAEKRDALLKQVAAILEPLGERVSGTRYRQHDKATVVAVRLALHEAAKPYLGWWFDQQKAAGKTDYELAVGIHPSWQGRMLDCGCAPLEHAYSRICCIDSQFREWEQPYYATHTPENAVEVGA